MLSSLYFTPHSFLSRGLRRNATAQDGILHPSWMWLCQAIYRWLLINPRPPLMLSQLVFSFLSQTQLHAQGCFAYRQMLADVNEKCCNHVIEPLAKHFFFTCRSIRAGYTFVLQVFRYCCTWCCTWWGWKCLQCVTSLMHFGISTMRKQAVVVCFVFLTFPGLKDI